MNHRAYSIFILLTSLLIFCTISCATLKLNKEKVGNLYSIKVNDEYGFIDKTGRVIIKPQYDDVWDFNEGLAPVENLTELKSIMKKEKL